MKVLLTGATGFLGWEVLDHLRQRGDVSIRVLARPGTLRDSERGRELVRMSDVEVVSGDLSDGRTVHAAHRGIDTVFHLAWKSGRGAPRGQAASSDESLAKFNIDTTRTLLDACREAGIRRLVYTSTVAVYGSSSDMSKWPVNEETPQEGSYGGDYSRNYIEPKRVIEKMIRDRAREAGFEYVILRPSIVYGVGSPMAEQMVRQALRGAPRRQQQQVGLQLVHVRDAARATVIAGFHQDASGREFNVAGWEVASPEEMNRMLRAAAFRIRRNLPLPGRFLGQFAGYRRYDTTKAELVLGFRPRVTLPEGLAELMASALGVDYTPTGFDRSTARVARAYDQRVDLNYLADYYDHSDFLNFGYWEEGFTRQKEACENQLEKLLARIPDKRGTILDVACGKGATTRYLTKYYRPEDITAINISEKHLEVARSKVPGATFLRMDAAELQFPDDSFDNVICVEAASHFNTRDRFLREALRVLKPGGRLVLSDAIFTPRTSDADVRKQQEANYVRSAEEYAEGLRRAGFEDVEVMDVTEPCWGGFREHLGAYLASGGRNGTLDRQTHAAISQWFERIRTYIETYVLGSGRKPLAG